MIKAGQERFVNLQISVVDTGSGLSKEAIDKLLSDYASLDDEKIKDKKLGLSICKRISEAMGGSLSIHSALGKGTSFNLNIKTKCKIQNLVDHRSIISE